MFLPGDQVPGWEVQLSRALHPHLDAQDPGHSVGWSHYPPNLIDSSLVQRHASYNKGYRNRETTLRKEVPQARDMACIASELADSEMNALI